MRTDRQQHNPAGRRRPAERFIVAWNFVRKATIEDYRKLNYCALSIIKRRPEIEAAVIDDLKRHGEYSLNEPPIWLWLSLDYVLSHEKDPKIPRYKNWAAVWKHERSKVLSGRFGAPWYECLGFDEIGYWD